MSTAKATFANNFNLKPTLAERAHTRPNLFMPFRSDVRNTALPQRFTFPFYYTPHPLAEIAAQEVQNELISKANWQHNFGLESGQEGAIIGKMFGVLVVQTQANELGYLAAFSGKLDGKNHHPGFVPPAFDMLDEGTFFRQEEPVINRINARIKELEADPNYLALQQQLKLHVAKSSNAIQDQRRSIKAGKKARDAAREEARVTLDSASFETENARWSTESVTAKYVLRDLIKWQAFETERLQTLLISFEEELEALRTERRNRSSALQQKLFDHYAFFNALGEEASLGSIFATHPTGRPPAGAGECAAPKLLQYAYRHHLKPIALAEFWWGASPASEIRKHQQYYPSCRGKCEPILGHMLQGLAVDENPMLTNPALGKSLPIAYEDASIIIINKPAEFLSVPGKNIEDSVQHRLKLLYPDAEGPLLVHRLDMSTSGILIGAKTNRAHHFLQRQFIRRTVEKRYIALVEGRIEGEGGLITLPLRGDLDDRPRQMVCFEHGKPAQTRWELASNEPGGARIRFYPKSGRTHQLRVHAAHPSGLGTPIVGDDLYGNRSGRLYLHAEYVKFIHPDTREVFEFTIAPEF
jgi:tRNA pseudouridine32 synthase/23S rRNA pseudouridine746 synthase